MSRSLLFVSLAFAACASHPKPVATPVSAAPTVPASVAALANGAFVMPDLGTHTRTVSTTSKDAQAYFDQGLRLTYGFNHDEATRSFAKAATLDPTCTACLWGVAFTLGPNYNVPMLPDRAQTAWDALQAAKAASAHATPVERALVEALSKRYGSAQPVPPPAMRPFNVAYADAMRTVAKTYPDDLDVQALFAESMMNIDPWKLYTPDAKPAGATPEIVSTLEAVLAKKPDHVGANHYYIHAIEASTEPGKATPSADRLAALMPGAGHIVHMPAHIYQRTGRYADAAETNRKAVAVDEAYFKQTTPPGYYGMYLAHNAGFLAYAASMLGRSEETLAAAKKATTAIPPQMLAMMPGMDFFVSAPLLAEVRFAKWDDILAEKRPPEQYQVMTAFWLHAHAIASCAKGKIADAEKDLAELKTLSGKLPADLIAGHDPARDLVAVAAAIVEARIAETKKQPAALALWAKAVALEDALAYSEPADWFYPVRHMQGAALLKAKKFADAEAVFREDLRRNPNNGWGLFGLAASLRGEKKAKDAAAIDADFKKAWATADVKLTSSVLY